MIRRLRAVAFGAAFYAATAFFGVLALPLLAGPRWWLLRPLRAWAEVSLWLLRRICGIRIQLDGRENLPAGAALIAAKHQSAFDTVVWIALLPDPAYVLKRELFAIPIYGWHARKVGMIAVDRASGPSSLRHLVRAARAALAGGRQVVIFPEGTRVPPGERQPFQPGIAALAAAMGLPVVPVATDSGRYWGRGLFAKWPGTIRISVLPPLQAGLGRVALLTGLEAAIEAEQRRLQGPGGVDNPVGRDARTAASVDFLTRPGR